MKIGADNVHHVCGVRALHASLAAMNPGLTVERVIRAAVGQISNEERDSEHKFNKIKFPTKQLAWAARDLRYNLSVVTKGRRRHYSTQIPGGANPSVYILDQNGDLWIEISSANKSHQSTETITTAVSSHNTCSRTKQSIETCTRSVYSPLGTLQWPGSTMHT